MVHEREEAHPYFLFPNPLTAMTASLTSATNRGTVSNCHPAALWIRKQQSIKDAQNGEAMHNP